MSVRRSTPVMNERTMLAEIMPLDEEHEGSVKLLMPVHYSEQIPRVSLRKHLHAPE